MTDHVAALERALARLTEAQQEYVAHQTPEALRASTDATFAYIEALRPVLGDDHLAGGFERAFVEMNAALDRHDMLIAAYAAPGRRLDGADVTLLAESEASVTAAMQQCETANARVMARLEEKGRLRAGLSARAGAVWDRRDPSRRRG